MVSPGAFHYQDGELCCEGVALRKIAREVGTPTYVYSRGRIVESYRWFDSSFAEIPHETYYAVKANSNLAILKTLLEQGSGFDVVSGGELRRLLTIGADAGKIVFSGVGKSREELELALDRRVRSINVESIQELDLIADLARKTDRVRISIRVNPDVDVKTHPYIATGLSQHKFGIDTESVEILVARLKDCRNIELTGLACHIGSQIMEVEPYVHAFPKLRDLAQYFRSHGFPVRQLDLGGGFGIPHRGEEGPDLSVLSSYLQQNRGDYLLLFEPGRIIVGAAGVLVCQVLYTKANQGKRFIVVDGAMNDFLRPSLYQAYHEVLPLVEKPPSIEADIVGPVCETGDFFARGRKLPDFHQRDYLALMDAGAYGFVFSSNYNSRPRAAEVLVDGASFLVVRKRETLEELVRFEAW